jgi:hypothetical protein
VGVIEKKSHFIRRHIQFVIYGGGLIRTYTIRIERQNENTSAKFSPLLFASLLPSYVARADRGGEEKAQEAFTEHTDGT